MSESLDTSRSCTLATSDRLSVKSVSAKSDSTSYVDISDSVKGGVARAVAAAAKGSGRVTFGRNR